MIRLVLTPKNAATTDSRVPLEIPKGARRTLGRSPDVDLCVRDPTVARRHASFQFDGERATVALDAGASSGAGDVWVNEERVQGARELSAGDTLRVGRITFAVGYES